MEVKVSQDHLLLLYMHVNMSNLANPMEICTIQSTKDQEVVVSTVLAKVARVAASYIYIP